MDFSLERFPDGTVCMIVEVRTPLGTMPFAFLFSEWEKFVDRCVLFSEKEEGYLSESNIPDVFTKAFE